MTRRGARRACPLDRFGASWRGRGVAVVGLGRSGLAAARLLREVGCRVRVTEQGRSAAAEAAGRALRGSGIEAVELGGHTKRFLGGAELLVVSPGVPETVGPVQWARERHLPVLSEVELAYHFCPSPLVAVTGTNGKSTAVTLIAEILRAAGRDAIACGNLGIPFSSVVGRLTPQAIAVVEVSSFQLLACEELRPKIAVLLNIGTNHLDRHADQGAYLAAKARLFRRQTPDDWAILNADDAMVAGVGATLQARCLWFGARAVNPPGFQLAAETRRILSASAQAVLQVTRLLGVPDPLAWQVIRAFRGLEHRLERVETIRGIGFINDSKSTTPDSLLFALAQTPGSVVVILGGRDKGLDFSPLAAPLHAERVRGVVVLGESRSRLRSLLNGATPVQESATLDEAVASAMRLARAGTTVLFSPACASFDMFRDFEDRGRAFKAIVRRLAGAAVGEAPRPTTGRHSGRARPAQASPGSCVPPADALQTR